MQPRGGRGGGSELLGIDGLVALVVLELGGDIGRQGHIADLFEDGIDVGPLVVHPHEAVSPLDGGENLPDEQPAAKDEPRARPGLFPRLHHDLPDVLLLLVEQEELHMPGRVPSFTPKRRAGMTREVLMTSVSPASR